MSPIPTSKGEPTTEPIEAKKKDTKAEDAEFEIQELQVRLPTHERKAMTEPKEQKKSEAAKDIEFEIQELSSDEEETVAGGSCQNCDSCGGVCTGGGPDQGT